jgi:hypothetical protein
MENLRNNLTLGNVTAVLCNGSGSGSRFNRSADADRSEREGKEDHDAINITVSQAGDETFDDAPPRRCPNGVGIGIPQRRVSPSADSAKLRADGNNSSSKRNSAFDESYDDSGSLFRFRTRSNFTGNRRFV